MEKYIDGIRITGNCENDEEIRAYIAHLKEKLNNPLKSLDINLDGEYADLNWVCTPVKFERIRRITGYLVGSMDKWNEGKTAEEKDRVKHTLEQKMETL